MLELELLTTIAGKEILEDADLWRACLGQVGGWRAYRVYDTESAYSEDVLLYDSPTSGVVYILTPTTTDKAFRAIYDSMTIESGRVFRSLQSFTGVGSGSHSCFEYKVPTNTKPPHSEVFNILFRRRLWNRDMTVYITV
jgi:hypothetical protein